VVTTAASSNDTAAILRVIVGRDRPQDLDFQSSVMSWIGPVVCCAFEYRLTVSYRKLTSTTTSFDRTCLLASRMSKVATTCLLFIGLTSLRERLFSTADITPSAFVGKSNTRFCRSAAARFFSTLKRNFSSCESAPGNCSFDLNHFERATSRHKAKAFYVEDRRRWALQVRHKRNPRAPSQSGGARLSFALR